VFALRDNGAKYYQDFPFPQGALQIENKRSVDEIISDFDAFSKFSQGVPKVIKP
jgi:hypothetical protein